MLKLVCSSGRPLGQRVSVRSAESRITTRLSHLLNDSGSLGCISVLSWALIGLVKSFKGPQLRIAVTFYPPDACTSSFSDALIPAMNIESKRKTNDRTLR